jgi:hypothetical protein
LQDGVCPFFKWQDKYADNFDGYLQDPHKQLSNLNNRTFKPRPSSDKHHMVSLLLPKSFRVIPLVALHQLQNLLELLAPWHPPLRQKIRNPLSASKLDQFIDAKSPMCVKLLQYPARRLCVEHGPTYLVPVCS